MRRAEVAIYHRSTVLNGLGHDLSYNPPGCVSAGHGVLGFVD